MNCGQIYNSLRSWQKLSGINMRPKLAYKVLCYTRLVSLEFVIINSQRERAIREVSGISSGDVEIAPDTLQAAECNRVVQEIFDVGSALPQIDLCLSDTIDAVDEKDETLTVQDLAFLEPFFQDYVEPENFRNKDGTPKTELNGE